MEVRLFVIYIYMYKKHEAVVDAAVKDFLTVLAGGDDKKIDDAVTKMIAMIKELWDSTGFAEHRKSLEDFGIEGIMKEAKVWLGHFVEIAKKSDGIIEVRKVQVTALAEQVDAALAAEWVGKVKAWVANNDLSTLITVADVEAAFAWAQENQPEATAAAVVAAVNPKMIYYVGRETVFSPPAWTYTDSTYCTIDYKYAMGWVDEKPLTTDADYNGKGPPDD